MICLIPGVLDGEAYGLTKYAPTEQLCQLATRGEPEAAADALIEAVRLPTGKFQDDVAVVLVA